MAVPLTKIPLSDFAAELLQDLPRLMKEHPDGVYLQHLTEEYGETNTRTLKVISMLESGEHIEVKRASNNSYYIVPKGHTVDTKLQGLSDLQKKMYTFIADTCAKHNTTAIRTNYTQLARAVNCSSGGSRTAIDRLVYLGYLTILTPSHQGKQSELTIGLLSDPNLPS